MIDHRRYRDRGWVGTCVQFDTRLSWWRRLKRFLGLRWR